MLLLIEAADSTVSYDREVKVPLYARAGIPEVWVVNLREDTIEIYVRPAGGTYQETRLVRRGESLAASSVAALTLDADADLG